MDYNDNDYEGQNLHLTGEESSKISVLRPFALPKFDFDDSLHAHLRFDSLVENEVFLGIPSQEDNHWIEDFSRGGNGIEFSSSATESCALPRHINVWSEATSSESVEMLLKAVGQDEMVPGEIIIGESDPGDQLGSSMIQMDDNLREDCKADDVDDPSLPPDDVGGNFSMLNQCVGVEFVQTEHILQVKETVSAGVDNEDSRLTVTAGKLNHSMKQANDNQGEACGLVDESLPNQIKENLPVLREEFANTEKAFQSIDGIRESVDHDKSSDINFASPSRVAEGISDPIGEQEKIFNENNSRLSGIAVETDNIEKHCSDGIPSGLQSPKEEHAIETCVTNSGEASSMPGVGESISTGSRCNEVAFALEPADCSQHCTVLDTKTMQLSEGHNILHEKSVITLQGEGKEGFGIEGSGVVAPELCGGNETKQAYVIQSPDQPENLIGNDDRSPKSKGLLEAPSASSESTMPPEITCNPSEKDDNNINHASDVPVNSTGCRFSGECSGEKSLTDDMEDAKCTAAIQKEKVEDEDHFPPPLVAVTTQTCTEDIDSMQVDAPAYNLDDISHEKEGEKLPVDSSKMVCDEINKEVGSTCPAGGVTVEKRTRLQPDSSIGVYPVLDIDVEDAKLAASCVGRDGLVDSHEHNPPLIDLGHTNQRETEFEAPKQPNTLVLKEPFNSDVMPVPAIETEKVKVPGSAAVENESEAPNQPSPLVPNEPFKSNELSHVIETEKGSIPGSAALETDYEAPKQPRSSVSEEQLKVNELAPAIDTEKSTMPGFAAGETKLSHQSVSLMEISRFAMPNESSKESNEKMENSANVSTAQEDGAEAASTEKLMEAEIKRNYRKSSSALSATSCTVENDKSKEPVPGASCTDPSQIQVNKQVPLKINDEEIGKVPTTSEIAGVNGPPKEVGTFTFDITHLGGQSTEDSGNDMQSFPRLQARKLSLTGEGSPSVSGIGQMEQMVVREISHVSSSTPADCPASGGRPSERKSRRGSASKSAKGSSKKGNLVKETSPLIQTEMGDKSSPLLIPSGTSPPVTFESSVKSKGAVSIPTSSLPDLNTSAPSSAFFQQPFTDLQQVQLRAQIFVYGSLIQGAAPDEACMVSAFDGGRSTWERSWRACIDKFHSKKSQGNNAGTPVPSHSGAIAPDQTNRQGFSQGEVLSSSVGRASNKAVLSPVANPLISLSSPLWSTSTPAGEALLPSSMPRGAAIDYQAVPPLNPYSTPPMRSYLAHTTWPSQASPAPFPVPWLSSSQSSPLEISTNHPTFPITEPVKSTAVKESPLAVTSGTKHAPPIPATITGPATKLPGASPLGLKRVKALTGQASDTKTRKRKKSSGADEVGQIPVSASLSETVSALAVGNQLSNKTPGVEDLNKISLTAQNQLGSMSLSIGNSYPTSVTVATPSSFVSKDSTNQAMTVLLPSVSGGHLNKGDLSMDKGALKFEGLSKVEEAKLQAEEAGAHAAAAISQCEGVWSQLEQQKSSGFTSDAESKLASAAVAIAAAASVAKAAAAAAKIASNAAVQAKQMADEALTASGTLNATAHASNLVYNSMNLVNASPSFILKGGDRNYPPSLAITAAREAARKRIEAASAASRHAENLDAIVKAAELAAEAVAHAGKVVAMGDPFSLSALAEAGPYNYWKVTQVATLPGSKSIDKNKKNSLSNNAGDVLNASNQFEGLDKDTQVTGHVVSPIQIERSRNVDYHVTSKENLIPSVKHGENSSKPYNDKKTSDPDTESRSNLSIAGIEEGSLVEILKGYGDLNKAWIKACAIGLKDGEVLVCYHGPQSEGSKELSEWIPTEAKDGDTPKVRVPHPMTTLHFHGTRKRRRAAVKEYSWSVGDRVDAWLQDCWCEGIVAEKDKKDATTLTVHFPAQGETLPVKMWNLRPSLVWSDGQWIEWSRPMQDGTSQGETPVLKRHKLGITDVEAKGKAKMANTIDFAETERNEEPGLPLSAIEKVFSIGSAREENKPEMVRTMKSRLEREGSRVVFGVPKPGKKRKFMEVSKHYVSDRTAKANIPNDSVKLSKYFMPQGSGSRGSRNNSKPDLKEKQVADSKPRALKSGKPPSIPSRTLSRKDDSTSSRRDAAVSEHSAKGSVSNNENESSEQNIADVEVASTSTVVFSSRALPRENRKKAVRNTKPERLDQGKLTPAGGRSARDRAVEKPTSEVAEPRRSSRRIQPTSRLLEGLQSSLIISKIPSSSNDKSHRSINKGSARGINNRG